MTVAARLRGHRRSGGAVAVLVERDEAVVQAVPAPVYVGLVTRTLAFGVDGAIINLVAILATAIATLAFSLLSLPDVLRNVAIAVGGVLYLAWVAGYFVVFWSTTGQTPGARLLRLRVCTADGDCLIPRRALVRFVGLTLAALPLFAGYLLILVDDRRRGLQDVLARSVVVDAPREPPVRGGARSARDRA